MAPADTSGGLPIFGPPLRLGELVATLALAQDNAFGQPLESQLRSCLLASWMCEAAGFDGELRETAYWVALLRFIGCTGHAHEVATLFGDEIAVRAQTLVHDSGNPAEVMHDIVAFATAGHSPEEREEIVRMIQETIRAWAVNNFSSGCEVADVLVERLDFGPGVREALRFTPGALTRAEFDRVELHPPMLTEQMLRRSPALALLNPVAAAHHEKCDGSGYHKRLRAEADDPGACVLAATEIYVGLTTERADRLAFSPGDAATELRRLESAGVLEPRASRAVLVAAGHGEPRGAPTGKRPRNPAGLTRRELEVLRLAARGLTTREVADRLTISPKTADHHIQHIYGKIGVSTRAAAALWAMQHTVVS